MSSRLLLYVATGCAALGWSSAATAVAGPQPWNGAALSDWTEAAKAVVMTDMTAGGPPAAFADQPKRGCWLTIPYEMRGDTGGHKGKAVWCGYEANAPQLSFRPKVTGWYAIFVGIPCGTGLWVRLDGDQAPLWCSNGVNDYYVNSVDTYFKAAELNEDSVLSFSPQRHGAKQPAALTHLILVPLSATEIETLKRDRADASHRTMAATYDGFSPICGRSPRTEEEVLSEVEMFRNSDFGTLLLHAGWSGDKTIYPSKVGYMPGNDLEDVAADYHRDFIDSIQTLAKKNINPIKVMIDGAHDMGMKVHVGIRPAGWSYYQPYNGLWDSPFYLNNPQWRCVDRTDMGAPELTRMSWAVPEVRAHLIDLLIEQVGFGADGAHVVFNRGYPLVLYENPFCEMFTAQHGIDPNDVGDEDPRILRLRADLVSTFFQELRTRLDGVERDRRDGKHLEISVMVLGTKDNNVQYGVDVERLAKEKLLDQVYVYQFDFGASKGPGYEGDYFRRACDDQGVPHFPTVDPPYEIKGQLTHALELYGKGAPGLTFWDAGGVDRLTWGVQTRLGHLEEVQWRAEHLDAANPPRSIHFYKWWGAQRMDVRFPPYWGG